MPKPKSNKISKKAVEQLIKITEANRKFCVVLGRKIHRLQETSTGFYDYHHYFEIRPWLRRGWYVADGHRTWIEVGETHEEYKNSFKEILDHGIKNGILYIKPNDPLIKFSCEWVDDKKQNKR